MAAFIFRFRLTKYLPNRVNIAYYWKYVAELELADREPMSSIDIIIITDLFGMLVLDDIRKNSKHELTAQNMTLDWILSRSIAVSDY